MLPADPSERKLTSGFLYGLWYYGILALLSFLVWFIFMGLDEAGGMTLIFFILIGTPVQYGIFASIITLSNRYIPLPGWSWKIFIPLLHFLIYISLLALSSDAAFPDIILFHFGEYDNPVMVVFFFTQMPLYLVLWRIGRVRIHLKVITADSRKK